MEKTILRITKKEEGIEVAVKGNPGEVMEAFEVLVSSLAKEVCVPKEILQLAFDRGLKRAQGIEIDNMKDFQNFIISKLMDEISK